MTVTEFYQQNAAAHLHEWMRRVHAPDFLKILCVDTGEVVMRHRREGYMWEARISTGNDSHTLSASGWASFDLTGFDIDTRPDSE